MIFDWNIEKNEELIQNRNISFERIVTAIEQDNLLDVLDHPNKAKYKNQYLILVEINEYVYVVPCVEISGGYFLKTAFPNRKYTKEYLEK